MHLDWYDRQILTFVLGWAPNSEPSDEEAFLQFGIDARRVMRRFDAVVDVFTSSQVPLEDPDLNLVSGGRISLHRAQRRIRGGRTSGPAPVETGLLPRSSMNRWPQTSSNSSPARSAHLSSANRAPATT